MVNDLSSQPYTCK